jgi:hypothetical protein
MQFFVSGSLQGSVLSSCKFATSIGIDPPSNAYQEGVQLF